MASFRQGGKQQGLVAKGFDKAGENLPSLDTVAMNQRLH
jgi:hypothetical protein